MNLSAKLRLLLVAAVAAALIVPAAARANLWWFDDEYSLYPVTADPKGITPELNEIKFEYEKVTYGPCGVKEDIRLRGQLYSRFGKEAEGVITEQSGGHKPCETTVEGGKCKVKQVTPTGFESPWGVALNESKVTISNMSFKVTLEGECGKSPLPMEWTASGPVSGVFLPYTEEEVTPSMFVFTSDPGLKVGEKELLFSGKIVLDTQFTAVAEPEGFTAKDSPADIEGVLAESTEATITRGATKVTCEELKVTGTGESGKTSLDLTPEFLNCFSGELPVLVDMNGCKFRLHLHFEIGEDEDAKYWALTDLACPAESEMLIDVYLTHAKFTEESGEICEYALGPSGNEGLEYVELENKRGESVREGWIRAPAQVGGIKSTRTVGLPAACGQAVDEKGTLTAELEIGGKGEKTGEETYVGVFPF